MNLLKSAKIGYFFDFDGTLAGLDKWDGLFKNNISCFQTLYFNPSVFDIRWCILTGRPRIDRPLIKLLCKIHNLKPSEIFTYPELFYPRKKHVSVIFDFKLQLMKDIIEGKTQVGYTTFTIEKIYYIDNNIETLNYINHNRKDYPILGLSVGDFYKRDFINVI